MQLFTNQAAGFSNANLIKLAGNIEIDVEEFTACLESGRNRSIVENQTAIGQQIGVQSAPTFLINGQGLIGAQPFSTFEQVIDYYLEQE